MSTAETVAVIMACHNRRDTSVRCLRALAAQQEAGVSISLFVTDDGSTDGTVQAIQALWPGATILAGDGSLYWAAAMALAERQAVRQRYAQDGRSTPVPVVQGAGSRVLP